MCYIFKSCSDPALIGRRPSCTANQTQLEYIRIPYSQFFSGNGRNGQDNYKRYMAHFEDQNFPAPIQFYLCFVLPIPSIIELLCVILGDALRTTTPHPTTLLFVIRNNDFLSYTTN